MRQSISESMLPINALLWPSQLGFPGPRIAPAVQDSRALTRCLRHRPATGILRNMSRQFGFLAGTEQQRRLPFLLLRSSSPKHRRLQRRNASSGPHRLRNSGEASPRRRLGPWETHPLVSRPEICSSSTELTVALFANVDRKITRSLPNLFPRESGVLRIEYKISHLY
jgi:hypothetical protein